MAIHEFDTDFRLTAVIHAEHGRYQPAHNGQASSWRLEGVETTRFNVSRTQTGYDALHAAVERRPETIWVSDLNPALLSVLAIAPDRMSALALWRYTSHLKENAQNANRYELALWKKVVYPLAIIVMLMLAVGFYIMNGLFSNLGLINTWPPWLAVSIPSILFLALALVMLNRVGRT